MTVLAERGTSVLDAGLGALLGALGASALRLVDDHGRCEVVGTPHGQPELEVTADDLRLGLWGPVRAEAAEASARLLQWAARRDEASEHLTAALVQAHDHLLAFYDLARLQIGSLDAAEAVEHVLAEILRLTGARAAVVIAAGDGAANRGQGTVLHAAGGDRGALAWLLESARHYDGRRVRSIGGGGRHGALAPVRSASEPPAVLGLASRSGRPCDTADLKLIDAIAATIAGIRELSGLHGRLLDRALIEREHDTASKLAQAVLPSRPPSLPGLHVFARSIPARTAGGDFFTFGALDGALHFAVGDVAGKGLPAALVMTKVVATTNAAFARHRPEEADRTLAEIDEELYDYLSDSGLFVTTVVGAFRPDRGSVYLCNAGHSPVMVVRRDGVETVAPARPPIGVLPGLEGTVQRLALGEGDLLVVGSDGLAEQEDAEGRQLGYDRLAAELAGRWGRPAAEVGTFLFDLVATHAGEVSAADDQTLVVLGGG